MKFTCLQENFVKGLSFVSKAVATKGSLPVLSNVLISSDNGRLKLSATNLETAITTWIGASLDEEGAITIPARVLLEFITNLPPSNINGKVKGSVLELSSDKVSSKFNGLEAAEFPSIPEAVEDINLSIDPKLFSEAIAETAFASATDETRPVLTGVYFNAEKDKLYLVGVDGFRLAERILPLEAGRVKKPFSAVIPAKTVLEVARLVSAFKEPLNISLNKDGNLVIFSLGDVLISSRVLEGEFPEYKKLIPDLDSQPVRVKLPSKDFVSALRLANVFAKDTVSIVKFKISSKDSAMYVTSSNNDLGENNAKVDAEVEGGELEIVFNSKYIMELLSNVKAEEFLFSCFDKSAPGKPGILRPVSRDNHTYLIMPMQY